MSADSPRVRADLVETLRSVACCDSRISVGEMGLVDSVRVDDDGVAHVEVVPCCTYGTTKLVHEVEREAVTVPGVTGVEVAVDWEETWSPERMAEVAADATPDIEELADASGVDPRWEEYRDGTTTE